LSLFVSLSLNAVKVIWRPCS